MVTRNVVNFEEQVAVTVQSDDFVVSPAKEVSVTAQLTAGTPATGCKVQITLDDVEKILAGTAAWINSPLGNRTTTGAEKILRPVTGVRLSVTDGTWTFQVRQA